MSQLIKFYFTSSMLNMFRILIHSSSGACDFSVVSPHWLRVLISTCDGFSVWMVGVVSVWKVETALQPSTHRNSSHVEIRTRNQCGDTTEKSQALDDGCINARNMMSIEEVK